MRVFDLMDPSPAVAEVPSDRAILLRLFEQHRVRGLPVVKSGTMKLAGIVRRIDLLRHPAETDVAILMDPNPFTIYMQAPLREAAEALVHSQMPLLPVVTGSNDLVGLVTAERLLDALIKHQGRIAPHLKRRVVPIHESMPARAAQVVQRITGASALPVVDDQGRLVGILTDGDLLGHAQVERDEHAMGAPEEHLRLPTTPVKRIMVRPVQSAGPMTTIGEASKIMLEFGWHQLPVVDDMGGLVDLVTDLDLLAALL